ncbi:hypothetical protein COO60DRAFT_1062491 [Scenedesmus sp. NREL 46B-D3]|nr:hypothetical protein COO60DRAFT_1062491 [Scenedesmus sp. NREL 46B-D3]
MHVLQAAVLAPGPASNQILKPDQNMPDATPDARVGNSPASLLCKHCRATNAQIWERRRRIPSTTYNDPLDHIFTEFDKDGDGHLTSEEIAVALNSRSVEITPAQIKEFIRAADENNNGTVERAEFPQLIFHMAIADLKSVQSMSME